MLQLERPSAGPRLAALKHRREMVVNYCTFISELGVSTHVMCDVCVDDRERSYFAESSRLALT